MAAITEPLEMDEYETAMKIVRSFDDEVVSLLMSACVGVRLVAVNKVRPF